MFRKILATFGLTAMLFAIVFSPANAVVTFDPNTGTGFVGKGDVQLVIGWNNQAFQTNASGVTFTYNATDTYEATCTWMTGEGTKGEKTHNVDHKSSTEVYSSVAFDARKNSQGAVTGFHLTGFGSGSESGEVPVVGAPCPGYEGHGGTWSYVSDGPISSTGGLYVNYGGASVLL